jgi:hypothetical protein
LTVARTDEQHVTRQSIYGRRGLADEEGRERLALFHVVHLRKTVISLVKRE